MTPLGNRSDRSGPNRPSRQRDAGIARGPGLAVAGVTAGIVFVIGLQLFPVKPRPQPAPPPAPPVAETPPPEATRVADAAVAVPAPPAADAGAMAAQTADAGTTAAEAKEKKDEAGEAEKPKKPEKTVAEGAEATDEAKPIDKQRQADKDLAREAWRHNRPDVSVTGNKTAIMVPIRGSIKGADFKILDKKRKVIVTLPKAVSMITLRVYNLKHPSFKKVWIDQDEANAQPADGTKLRFILSQTFDPQVEITDDFVRVTIRRPESSEAAEGASEKHAEKRSEHSERTERSEKPNEPSEEAAPAPEKSGD
jgi:hypothetical protein